MTTTTSSLRSRTAALGIGRTGHDRHARLLPQPLHQRRRVFEADDRNLDVLDLALPIGDARSS